MKEDLLDHAGDPAGYKTLELFAGTDHFNAWLFNTLAPFCKDNILEIGSGIGNISAFIIKHFKEVSLSDVRDEYCEVLRARFGQAESLQDIYLFDLSVNDIEKTYPHLPGKFDTIITSNVVEHIGDDRLAVSNCNALLRKGGRLVVLVPAYRALYNSFDKALGHYRRYDHHSLPALLQSEGFEIKHTQYFNAAGVLGWWFSGNILKKKLLPKNQLALYDKLVPFIRIMDQLLMHRFGLSVIAVGEKK